MIDETKTRIPIWLVWSTSQNGLVSLEAVALTNQYARSARAILLTGRPTLVRVYIERTEANHLFAVDLEQMWWRLYGSEVSDYVERRKETHSEKVKQTAIRLGNALFDAIAQGDKQNVAIAAMEWRLFAEQEEKQHV